MKLTHWYWQNDIFFTSAGGDDDMMVIDHDHYDNYSHSKNLLVLLVFCNGSEEVGEVCLTFAVRNWTLRAGKDDDDDTDDDDDDDDDDYDYDDENDDDDDDIWINTCS